MGGGLLPLDERDDSVELVCSFGGVVVRKFGEIVPFDLGDFLACFGFKRSIFGDVLNYKDPGEDVLSDRIQVIARTTQFAKVVTCFLLDFTSCTFKLKRERDGRRGWKSGREFPSV